VTLDSIKKRVADGLSAIVIAVAILFATALLKGEQLKGLSYVGKIEAILTTGVPLWIVLPLGIFAVIAGWEIYTKPNIRQIGQAHYYFKSGRELPYCQPCYDVNTRLVPVTPQQRYTTGIGRSCNVCGKTFIESYDPPGKI
jgi:hypothetical protein